VVKWILPLKRKHFCYIECYFRNGVKQENGDLCIDEFQARHPNRMDIDYYQQVYQRIKIIVPNFRKSGSIIKKKAGRPLVRNPNVQQIAEEHPSTSSKV
jgi:hypothetical protein